MSRKDMILLIEAEDAILNMDKALVDLTGFGHSEGKYYALDNVYEVIRRNSNEYYRESGNESDSDIDALFYDILTNQDVAPEIRADILINATIKHQ